MLYSLVSLHLDFSLKDSSIHGEALTGGREHPQREEKLICSAATHAATAPMTALLLSLSRLFAFFLSAPVIVGWRRGVGVGFLEGQGLDGG